MNEGEVQVQSVGESGGTLCSAGVGRDDHGVLVVEVFADVAEGEGFGVQAIYSTISPLASLLSARGESDSLIDWYIKEALYLRRMEVHRDDMVAPGALNHIRNEFR